MFQAQHERVLKCVDHHSKLDFQFICLKP